MNLSLEGLEVARLYGIDVTGLDVDPWIGSRVQILSGICYGQRGIVTEQHLDGAYIVKFDEGIPVRWRFSPTNFMQLEKPKC